MAKLALQLARRIGAGPDLAHAARLIGRPNLALSSCVVEYFCVAYRGRNSSIDVIKRTEGLTLAVDPPFPLAPYDKKPPGLHPGHTSVTADKVNPGSGEPGLLRAWGHAAGAASTQGMNGRGRGKFLSEEFAENMRRQPRTTTNKHEQNQ